MGRYFSNYNLLSFFAICWLTLLLSQFSPLRTFIDYGGFAFLGILGAIFANATGAGGGVIFLPFFNQLNFDASTTVATSLAIQCFGMTAGSIAWLKFYNTTQTENRDWSELGRALKLTIPLSVVGILVGQCLQYANDGIGEAARLHVVFGCFSILLALAIFASIPLLKQQNFRQTLSRFDCIFLALCAVIGGVVTAYLSIGVGELVAVFLIMRRFNVTFSIAVAVILSAFSVWSAIVFHLLVTGSIYWPVVLFAGPGAAIGGTIAKYLVLYFSPQNVKIFFAAWVLLLGVSSMPY